MVMPQCTGFPGTGKQISREGKQSAQQYSQGQGVTKYRAGHNVDKHCWDKDGWSEHRLYGVTDRQTGQGLVLNQTEGGTGQLLRLPDLYKSQERTISQWDHMTK